jgi:hypothetical protein
MAVDAAEAQQQPTMKKCSARKTAHSIRAASGSTSPSTENPLSGADPTLAFDDQKSKVRLGLKAAEEFAVWFREHQASIERIVLG